MAYYLFTLFMPGVSSWNGRWSCEGNLYARVRTYRKEPNEAVKDGAYFTYNFGDGWCAGVEVRRITAKEATKARRKTKGFCGYDWMIDEIEMYGHILTLQERKTKGATP